MKKNRFDLSDFLILIGVLLIGAGLYLWFGPGPAVTVTGALAFFIGLWANLSGSR